MSQHPLIDLSNDREVKQAKGFREAAAKLTGQDLAAHYQKEIEAAPRRHSAEKKYLGNHPGKPPSARKNNRDEEHLGFALLERYQREGQPFQLPRGAGDLHLFDYQVPLASAAPDKAQGDADPNKGVGKIGLLGMGPTDHLAVCMLKFLAPDATRSGTGDTPLRQLLEGLAYAAMAEANRDAIQQELTERGIDRKLSEDPPSLMIAATPRYWQLCRRREAQKGAAWIKELERLSRETVEEIGLQIFYIGLELDGNPGWEYGDDGPVLKREVVFDPAWERNAGRVRPKSAPKSKSASPAEVVVEADLSKPVRNYGIRESYEAGERIQHPTLGLGVVQGPGGPGKIFVRFEERRSLLIHERA